MFIKRRHVIAGALVILAAGAGINLSNPGMRKAAAEYAERAMEAPAGYRLIVNAPANKLYVYKDGVKVKTFLVSIGRKGFETPPGKYSINHVVMNPWWHPPESNWARDQQPQPPGPDNPMGRAKLYFANLLYIHGSPMERQLGEPASHGCIHMANDDVLELTRMLAVYAAPKSLDVIEAAIRSTGLTREVWFQNKIPLDIQYNIVEVADGNLEIHPDVYKLAKSSVRDQVVQAVAQEGFDPANIDEHQLVRLMDKQDRRGTSVRMPLDTLMASTTVASASQAVGGQ